MKTLSNSQMKQVLGGNGGDLSDQSSHTGGSAGSAGGQIGASAYTKGNDTVLESNQTTSDYTPEHVQ